MTAFAHFRQQIKMKPLEAKLCLALNNGAKKVGVSMCGILMLSKFSLIWTNIMIRVIIGNRSSAVSFVGLKSAFEEGT